MRELRSRTAPVKPRAIKVGATVQEIAEQIRQRQTPRFFGLIPEQAMLLGRFYPDIPPLTIRQADKILAHKFDLLGSGEKDLGKDLNWQTDFKTGHKWPVEYHTRIKLTSKEGGFDVKVPWELSRFHHALRLGQAYLYTQDEKYAREIVSQITAWIKANPYEFGVNWSVAMEVAIRAVNWVWAYYLIIESKALTTDFLALWLTSLRQHGEFIFKNLEDGWPRTNHLIADLTGLAHLGILFPEFPEAEKWQKTALTRLWEELDRQVYPDGVDYEASTAYHRLVTEMVLSVVALCVINHVEIPPTAEARLKTMLDVILAYTAPDGLAPQIGDADDGRLLPLSVHADPIRERRDHRHLLALGSLVLEREMPEWAGYVEPTERGWSVAAEDQWQDAFWYFASDSAARLTDVMTRITQRPPRTGDDDWIDVKPGIRVRARALARRPVHLDDVVESRGLEAGGWYIMRHEDFHLLVDAGSVGQGGAGGHAHNDTLSFTLYAHGRPFLIDPGSYVYTADPEQRNHFRSTAFHNVAQVAHYDLNRTPKDDLFTIHDDASVTVHHWESHDNYDFFDASHNGYTRLKPGVIHRRQIWFDKVARLWVLHDNLKLASTSNGSDRAAEKERKHLITTWFHFAPLRLQLNQPHNAFQTEESGAANLILLPLGDFPLKPSLEEGWYSPRYGVKDKAPVARFTGRVTLPVDLVMLIYPYQGQADFKIVREAGRAALTSFQRALSPASRAHSPIKAK